MLNNAQILLDLRVPPNNRLEALRGDRAGQHSIRINEQWRICFRWQDGDAQYELAKRVRVPITRIAEICRRRRAITADTALRLGRFFGTTSKFWLGLQEDYDLEEELRARRREIDAIEPLASNLPAAW